MGDAAEQDADVNTMIAAIGRRDAADQRVRRGHPGDRGIRAPCSTSSGINYGDARYALDRELFPNRVIVGSETFPAHIDELWRLVREQPARDRRLHLDRLGLPRRGRHRARRPPGRATTSATGIAAPYPWLTGWVGDIDITGHRRPMSYYRETVFGLRHAPYIAVHRPQFHGRADVPDAVVVDGLGVELELGRPGGVARDRRRLQRRRRGRAPPERPLARPLRRRRREGVPRALRGRLRARRAARGRLRRRARSRRARRCGRPTARCASPRRADRDAIRADDTDLAYVAITLAGRRGQRRRPTATGSCPSSVDGAGVLAGLGSADPRTEEPFGASRCTTFDGRALAIVRPTGPGDIEIRVSADGRDTVTATRDRHRPFIEPLPLTQPAEEKNRSTCGILLARVHRRGGGVPLPPGGGAAPHQSAAVSARIRALELELGVRLFHRGPGAPVSLTPAGTALLPLALEIVELVDSAQAGGPGTARRGRRARAWPSPRASPAGCWLARPPVPGGYPDIELTLCEMDARGS